MENKIIIKNDADDLTAFAAHELRRYIYLLTGSLESILFHCPATYNRMILGTKDYSEVKKYVSDQEYVSLKDGGYIVKSVSVHGVNVIVFTGNESIAVLYAVYAFLEQEGIRFYLHGDVLPDFYKGGDIFLRQVEINENPLFEIRGILPFHDFPEGPDWWSKENYLGVLSQLVKLRANFWGFHTYPENAKDPNASTAEPLVWIGRAQDCDVEGNVLKSYPVQHFKTNGSSWGYHSYGTEEYPFGLGQLFEKNYYCPDYMNGYEELDYHGLRHDQKVAPELYNKMFNTFGDWLQEIFQYARKLQVKICIGTETPLMVPDAVKRYSGIEKMDKEETENIYHGIFERIMRKYPIDYYWLWTPEKWTWEGNTKEETQAVFEDIHAAVSVLEKSSKKVIPVLCGWVLGPGEDRAMFDRLLPENIPFSCINQSVGFDPIDPVFREIMRRPKWAIPWLEDDPAMTSQQLWVGRMRRDAYDAFDYGCNGLIGIHWRTKAIAPNFKALMEAAWKQTEWDEGLTDAINREGFYGESVIQEQEGVSGIYASARVGMEGYRLRVPAGEYRLILSIPVQRTESNSSYRVKINQICRAIVNTADMVKASQQEITIEPVWIGQDKILDIHFEPFEGVISLSGITVLGSLNQNQLGGKSYSRRINCGGVELGEYEKDLGEFTGDGRSAGTYDFYLNWACSEFGEEVGAEAAEIMSKQDGRLPRPTNWVDGPGNIVKNPIPWEQVQELYTFVERFDALGERVTGAGQKQRFEYWRYQFNLLKLTAKTGCLWSELEQEAKAWEIARAQVTYRNILDTIRELEYCVLMAVETAGELGVLVNLQQRSVIPILNICRKLMKEIGAEEKEYGGSPVGECEKLIIPAIRTCLRKGEDLLLKVIVAGGFTGSAKLYWRALGEEKYREKTLCHVKGWVYQVVISQEEIEADFEYHIVVTGREKKLVFPSSELNRNQTVVLW